MTWNCIGTHLIANIPDTPKSNKLACFDLDGTLINTSSGLNFSRSPSDWQFWRPKQQAQSVVVSKLLKLVESGFTIVIFTNQATISLRTANSKSYTNFTRKLDQVIKAVQRDIPQFAPLVLASPGRPGGNGPKSSVELHTSMRKPEVGMWNYMLNYIDNVDMDHSFYVGDAAGREHDFLDSDLKFAENIQIRFMTPEEFFIS